MAFVAWTDMVGSQPCVRPLQHLLGYEPGQTNVAPSLSRSGRSHLLPATAAAALAAALTRRAKGFRRVPVLRLRAVPYASESDLSTGTSRPSGLDFDLEAEENEYVSGSSSLDDVGDGSEEADKDEEPQREVRDTFAGREPFPIFRGSYASKYQDEGFDWRHLSPWTPESPKKKTLALAFGYEGRAYFGLQQVMWPGMPFLPTVEAELELALLKAGAIMPTNFGNLKKINFTRVGRTDRGVNAACNVVTARLHVGDQEGDIERLVQSVNSFLPDDIVVHSATRVTKRFNARGDGTSRGYVYYLPSFCVRKGVIGAMEKAIQPFKDAGKEVVVFNNTNCREYELELGLREVRLSNEELAEFHEVLQDFVGSKWFGNYSNARIKPFEPEGWRRVRTIHCDPPVVDSFGQEWIPIHIVGDSFLTHMLRKIFGTAALVVQGFLTRDFLRAALAPGVVRQTPRLPSLGLIFRRPWFLHSKRGAVVEAMLNKEAVQDESLAWRRELELRIFKEAEAKGIYGRWLACTAFFKDEWQNHMRIALEAFKVEMQDRDRRIAAKAAKLAARENVEPCTVPVEAAPEGLTSVQPGKLPPLPVASSVAR